MSLIDNAIKVARKYYDENTYYHAMRVAAYVTEDNLISSSEIEFCTALAIMHDLLEDTSFEFSRDFNMYGTSRLEDCLSILTKEKDCTYEEYIKNIKNSYPRYPEAYWVKLADIKDHLCQTTTLTDELKEKYIKVIPYLL